MKTSLLAMMTMLPFLPLRAETPPLRTPEFKLERIDRTGQGFRKSALRRTSDGKIHVAYTGCSDTTCTQNELFYAVRDLAGKWKTTTVDSKKDTGWFSTLEVSQNGIPHLFYTDHEKHEFRYATLNEKSEFITRRLQKGWGGWWTSSSSHQDTIYVAHTKFPKKDMLHSTLELLTLKDGKFSFQTVDNSATEAGWNPSITTDKKGLPVIAYLNLLGYPYGDLKIASVKGERPQDRFWQSEDIDGPVIKSSVVIDSNNFAHVVYQKADTLNPGSTDLLYSTNSPDGIWKKSYIDIGNPPEADTGLHPSLAIDRHGGLHVFYRDLYRSALVYARYINGEWQKTLIDSQGSSGFYSSVQVDDADGVHVIFGRSNQLFYGYCSSCALRP